MAMWSIPLAQKLFEYTGCDAVLLARGTMGKPWLIEDIYRYFSGQPPLNYKGPDYRDVLLEHLDHIVPVSEPATGAIGFASDWLLVFARG